MPVVAAGAALCPGQRRAQKKSPAAVSGAGPGCVWDAPGYFTRTTGATLGSTVMAVCCEVPMTILSDWAG